MNANYKRPLDVISNEKDPWKEDAFGSRKTLAAKLIPVLKSTSGPCVFGIDSEYGTGKTFFLTRLKEDIKNQGGWCVYLNAWAYEQYNQPLVALLDALKMAEGEKPDDEKNPSKLKTVVTQIVPFFAKQAVKRAVDYALGEGTVDGFADIAGDAAEKAAEAFLETKGSLQKNIDDAKDALREFVNDKFKLDSEFKSLVILIDELDRVRPDFALHFLETIKHLFDVTGVVFVIAADRKILEVSARHAFGQDLPIDGYFRRLFDTWIKLPPYEPQEYIKKRIHEYKLVEDGYLVEHGNRYRNIDSYSDVICNFGDTPSLRFIDQSIADLNLILRLHSFTIHQNSIHFMHDVHWIAFMQILKMRSSDNYEIFLNLMPLLQRDHKDVIFLLDGDKKEEFYKFFSKILNDVTEKNGNNIVFDLIFAILDKMNYEKHILDRLDITDKIILGKIEEDFKDKNITEKINLFKNNRNNTIGLSNRDLKGNTYIIDVIKNLHTQMNSFGV